jgi:hypothetical protein
MIVIFEVSAGVNMKSAVFWHVTRATQSKIPEDGIQKLPFSSSKFV